MAKISFQTLDTSLKELGVSTHLLSLDEKSSLQKEWRKVFAYNLRDKIDWHTFSFNLSPHLSGVDAINSFNSQPVKNYFIISSNVKLTGLACEGNKILTYSDLAAITSKSPFLFDLY
ncbi:MAG: hypothetical protein ACKO96_41855, partial [Flammeovirgaceae bacterium]